VFSHTECTGIAFPDSRFRDLKIRTVHCSSLRPLPPDLDAWIGQAGGMCSARLAGERVMLSLWWVEGSTGIWVTGGDSRLGQWIWFRFALGLRGSLSGVVGLARPGVVSWEFQGTRRIGLFRCRAAGPGCGCMVVLHMDEPYMGEETLGCCAVVVEVHSHTEEIWSCQSVGASDAAVALVYWHAAELRTFEGSSCDFVGRLCLYTTGYRIGYKVEHAAARAQLRMSEETLQCYIGLGLAVAAVAAVAVVVAVAVVAAAAAAAGAGGGFEPKVHNWLGAVRWVGSCYSLGLFPDSEISLLSHLVRMTMLAVAALVILPLQDAAGEHSGPPGEGMIYPVCRMGASQVVFPYMNISGDFLRLWYPSSSDSFSS